MKPLAAAAKLAASSADKDSLEEEGDETLVLSDMPED
jgi:hypothetical protein